MTYIADTWRRVAACSPSRLVSVAVVVGALLLNTTAGHAAGTPLEQCQKGQLTAAAKYTQCELRALGKGDFISGFYFDDLQRPLSKCRAKYAVAWTKLQAKATGTGSPCDGLRYVDNSNGTANDRLTNLQWEQKTDDATIHDKDNVYTWTDPGVGSLTDADGAAFTTFLETLNSVPCFAGQCDWRLPTRLELQTILLPELYPCTTSPCIDPVFGPTAALYYNASTTYPTTSNVAWVVGFSNGDTEVSIKSTAKHARAVRGGL